MDTQIELEAGELPALAAEINEHYRFAVRAGEEAVRHAIEAGTRLTKAKAAIPHGSWQQWVAENFDASLRTAQQYMRLAERREEAQRLAHLGLAGVARALVSASRAAAEVPEEFPVLPDELPTTNHCPKCKYKW